MGIKRGRIEGQNEAMFGSNSRSVIEWLCDVERMLRHELDKAVDLVDSRNPAVRKAASQRAEQILQWLEGDAPPKSDEYRISQVREIVNDVNLSLTQQVVALKRVLASSGKRRGRPRTENGCAVTALSMHLAGVDWRVIASQLRGCTHKGSTPIRSCPACRDSIRNISERLESFLQTLEVELPDDDLIGSLRREKKAAKKRK